MEVNPYQSPEVAEGPPRLRSRPSSMSGVHVDGKYLVVFPGTALPSVCVKTNQPVSADEMVHRTMSWCSPAVLLLLLLPGLLRLIVLLVAYFVFRKRCDLTFGLSSDRRRRYRRRLLVKSLVCVGFLLAIPVAAAADSTPAIVTAVVLFFVSLMVAAIGNSPLSIARHRDGLFWIKGCCPEFLAEMDKWSAPTTRQ